MSTVPNSVTTGDKLTIQIWTDVVCPFCPIGERRLQRALDDLEGGDRIELRHRSYRLMPGLAPLSIEDYLSRKMGAHQQPEAFLRQITQFAAQDGLTYRLSGTKIGDTLDAHRLLHFAATQGKRQELDEQFYRYFTDRADVFDHDSLLRLASLAGLDERTAAGVLNSDRFASEVEADQREAARLGIAGVPHFLIGGKTSVSGGQSPEAFRSVIARALCDAEAR